jgi:hypothetical protein
MSGVVIGETVRSHLTNFAYWAFVALTAIIAFGTARFNTPAAMWPSLITLLSIIVGAAPIGPEFSSGTLQLILVKPLTRSAYLLSRVIGVSLMVWLAASIAAGAELIARAALTEEIEATQIGVALLNGMAESFLTISLLTFFGSFNRAYFNVAMYIALQAVLSIAIGLANMGRRFPGIARFLSEVSRNLFPDAPRALDGRWLLLVLSNAAVALVLACLIFRKREVPYGAD